MRSRKRISKNEHLNLKRNISTSLLNYIVENKLVSTYLFFLLLKSNFISGYIYDYTQKKVALKVKKSQSSCSNYLKTLIKLNWLVEVKNKDNCYKLADFKDLFRRYQSSGKIRNIKLDVNRLKGRTNKKDVLKRLILCINYAYLENKARQKQFAEAEENVMKVPQRKRKTVKPGESFKQILGLGLIAKWLKKSKSRACGVIKNMIKAGLLLKSRRVDDLLGYGRYISYRQYKALREGLKEQMQGVWWRRGKLIKQLPSEFLFNI